MFLDSCRTGKNGGLEDRYLAAFLFTRPRVGEAGATARLTATVGCWRVRDSGRNRLRCSCAGRDSDGQQPHDGSHHELFPEPGCLCSPTGSKSSPAPGRVSVHSVSPRSGAISATLLPNLRLTATAPGKDSLVPARPVPDDGNWPRTAVHLVAPPRPARGLYSGGVAVTDVTASQLRLSVDQTSTDEQLSLLDQGVVAVIYRRARASW
jgi:hypothetical protein